MRKRYLRKWMTGLLCAAIIVTNTLSTEMHVSAVEKETDTLVVDENSSDEGSNDAVNVVEEEKIANNVTDATEDEAMSSVAGEEDDFHGEDAKDAGEEQEDEEKREDEENDDIMDETESPQEKNETENLDTAGKEELMADDGIATADIVTSGTCGDNLVWELVDGTLIISGTGDMFDYDVESPWRDFSSSIETAIIQKGVTNIGKRAFWGCNNLTNITIPNSVASVGENAFYQCERLRNITIPNSVTRIDDGAFSASGLTNLEIPDSVTYIGGGAFNGCGRLTSINIPSSVTSIENSTFDSCDSLTSINIPSSVTSIGDHAFAWCWCLADVDIPNSVTNIGSGAFFHCVALKTIDIPDSVVSIGSGAFNQSGLTNIRIPNSVTSIELNTFKACDFTSINIPNSVTNIGDYAFSDCIKLSDVYYEGSEESWNAIFIGKRNECLTNATIHYNSTGMGSGGGDDSGNTPVKPPTPSVTDTSIRRIGGKYYDTIAKSDVNWNADFGWDYFVDSKNYKSTEYNSELAKVSLALCASLERSYDSTKKILEGFGSNGLECTVGKTQFDELSPAIAIASKSIVYPDNTYTRIFIIVLRGTTSDADIGNDIGSGLFWNDWGVSDIESYISDYISKYGVTTENTKFLVTGHSLGGACANIVARDLSEAFGTEDVFAYTFAAPSPYQHRVYGEYNNIHNFLCYQDNVPLCLVGRINWYGYGKCNWFGYGYDRTLDNCYYDLTGKEWKTTYDEQFLFRLHAPSAYYAYVLCDWYNSSGLIYGLSIKCPVDVWVYDSNGNLVGHIQNDKVDFDNYADSVMLAVEDTAKYVYLIGDDTYTFKITGTDTGTMTCTAFSIDMNTNTVVEAKPYSNVQIENNKTFRSIVSSYGETDINKVDIPDVELLVIDDEGDAIARVLSDNEASTEGKSNGTEIPIKGGDDNPGGDNNPSENPGNNPDDSKPGNSSEGNSNSSNVTTSNTANNTANSNKTQSYRRTSYENDSNERVVESWKPITPDEKKRYACMGTDAVQYTLAKDNAYRIIIQNAMQGPLCFKSFEAVLGDYTIGRTYNIYTVPDITYSMEKEIEFTIKIPADIYKSGREYKMICVTQNGLPVILDDLDSDSRTITVRTNKFYAYALIYK